MKIKVGYLLATFAFFTIIFVPTVMGSMFKCLKLRDRKERNGCITIEATKSAMNQYKSDVDSIEKKTGSARKIKQTIKSKEADIENIKQKHNITTPANEVQNLENELETIGARVFAKAQDQYSELNGIIKGIIEDMEVKNKLNEIFKLKAEIEERLESKIKRIKEIGEKIIELTKTAQEELDTFKREKYIPKRQELARLLLSEEVKKEIEAAGMEIIKSETKLKKELETALTSQEQRRKERLKSSVERYNRMIEFMKDPKKLQTINLEQMLGL